MLSADILINTINGLDSKSAALLIQKASLYESEIWFEYNNRKANVKSLLGLLSLCVSRGEKVSLIINGADEEKAIGDMELYINSQWIKDSV